LATKAKKRGKRKEKHLFKPLNDHKNKEEGKSEKNLLKPLSRSKGKEGEKTKKLKLA
jgi:hypothetical protein